MAVNERLNAFTLDELLNTPIRDLRLSIEGTVCERGIKQLRKDLKDTGIILDLTFYVSTEWGCDVGTSNIGIPFWELEPRLKKTCEDLTGISSYINRFLDTMGVLRHEAGHAFLYRNRIYRRHDFRRMFDVKGRFFDYPRNNNYKPSRRVKWQEYVNPNGDNYAATDPDEDFAETFSVHLSMTQMGWRRVYARRNGALEKLEYITRIIKEFYYKKPLFLNNPHKISEPADALIETLIEFFERERTENRAGKYNAEHNLIKNLGPLLYNVQD